MKSRFMVVYLILALTFYSALMTEAAKKNAQEGVADPAQRLQWLSQQSELKEKSLFKHLPWQFLGPVNVSGRMTDVEVVAPKGKNYTIYAATASGGLWKTINEGTTWVPVFQHDVPTTIGDVAIAPSNPDIIWIGTGEANIFRSSQAGCGVYLSRDAGKTWTYKGLGATHTIPRIVIHPKNPDVVYVASSGHEWTHNAERGVYKTTDGGNSWSQVFFKNQETGVIDLVMDPADPETLYAAAWQRTRKKWNDPRNEPHYDGSGIYKSRDGGKSWLAIDKGLPPAKFRGRIGLDLCRAKPQVIYAFIDNYEIVRQNDPLSDTDSYGRPKNGVIRGAAIFRSDDGGDNWRQVSPANSYMENLSSTYGWVFGQIRVDPVDENKIYVMGLDLNVSTDGGKTFRTLEGMHLDHHGIWIDPENTHYLVNVNDGGIVISYDGGENWKLFTHNFPVVQFFTVNYDMGAPFHVYGSVQDHGSYRCVVDLSHGRYQIPAKEWERAPGGEGSCHAIDPTDPNIVYAAGFYGNIFRENLADNKYKTITPKAPEGEHPYRGQWLAPFMLSPHNPRILYLGLNYMFRSLDRGERWERISPDLTWNDPAKIGDIQYQTIFTISESPLKFGLIYAGTDDGRIHVTHNGGGAWKDISAGVAPNRWISRVVASAFSENAVYMTQNGKRDDDFSAYIWKSSDFGKTWKSIVNNIPGGPVNVIREDPKNKNVLYVGTDLGVYVSIDGGNSWHSLCRNIPTVYVHDLIVHPRDNILVAATHGRGMWAMDVTPIQQLTPEILAKPLSVFKPDNPTVPKPYWRGWYGGVNAFIPIFVKSPAPLTLTFKNSANESVAEISISASAGMNLAEWDLKRSAAPESDKNKTEKSPYVEPGKYKVVISAQGQTAETELEVLK